MSADKEKLEDVFQRLPENLQNEVIAFAESLLNQDGTRSDNTQCAGQSVRNFFGIWDSGNPQSANNEGIDADLGVE